MIGAADGSGPRRASVVVDEIEDPEPEPATDKQLVYLKDLGAPDSALGGISRDKASDLIDDLIARRRAAQPPTEKQLAFLKDLGASEDQIATLKTKGEASTLIETLKEAGA